MLYSVEIGVRLKTPAFGRLTPGSADGRPSSAHVEVLLSRLERLLREERCEEPLGILAELRQQRVRVALADDEQVDLVGRGAVLEERRQRTGWPFWRRCVHESRRRIDVRRPDPCEAVVGLTLFQRHPHGAGRPRKAKRFVERPVRRLHFRRRFPLAVHRREAARVQQPVARRIVDLEQVLSEVRRIDELRPAAGPRSVVDHAIERQRLGGGRSARMEVVHAHRPAEVECVARLDELEEQNEPDADHGSSIIRACANLSC